MNYKKIILLGCASATLVILTSTLGVEGTVIGSLLTSVIYNTFSQALDEPISGHKTFSRNFEWEIAYVFPLIVIVLIQLLLILAILSGWGFLPESFLDAFLSLQKIAANNLYRILGIATLVISVYPLILKPDIIKKSDGAIIGFVGLIFLARGFVDLNNSITDIYDGLFIHFDFPIAVFALVLLVFVIYHILSSAKRSQNEFAQTKHHVREKTFGREYAGRGRHSKKHNDFDYEEKIRSIHSHKKNNGRSKVEVKDNSENVDVDKKPQNGGTESKPDLEVGSENETVDKKPQKSINKSSGNIQFESNDLLDEYKK